VDSGVIDGDAALRHHFLEVPQAQAVGQIPPHAQRDHRAVELPAFKPDHPCLKPLEYLRAV
jgi:hypothetical protein